MDYTKLFKKKVELVQQKELTNKGIEIWYFVRVDGYLVSNTHSMDKDQAKELFDMIVKAGGDTKTETVIKTQFLETEKPIRHDLNFDIE